MKSEIIKKYINEENVEALCDMADDSLKNGNQHDCVLLSEAISEILSLWIYDFYCKKGGDPIGYPYIRGLETLEALERRDHGAEKGKFYSICCEYQHNT